LLVFGFQLVCECSLTGIGLLQSTVVHVASVVLPVACSVMERTSVCAKQAAGFNFRLFGLLSSAHGVIGADKRAVVA
jgi:hypothetical protein